MASWRDHRDVLCKRIYTQGPDPDVLISSVAGSAVISHARCDPFEGRGDDMVYAVVALCTEGGGRTRRERGAMRFDDVWRPGKVGLMLPGPAAQGFSPGMKVLSIAFDMNEIATCYDDIPSNKELQVAAGRLCEDPLVSAVMIAILRDAEAHGAASPFFYHALTLILKRLFECSKMDLYPKPPARKPGRPAKIGDILECIENSLGDDIKIRELSSQFGMAPRSFTQLFRSETGYTPYQYLTHRRIERAKGLLRDGFSVTDTASTVGYENPAKFAAVFRRWVGLSPSAWKAGGLSFRGRESPIYTGG